jgi:hypothetical protein
MENTVVLFLQNFLFDGQDLIIVIFFLFLRGGWGGRSLVIRKGSLISELCISFFMGYH